MESEKATKPPSSLKEPRPVVQLHPELLMAARQGDWRRLNDILEREEEPALVPRVVVDIVEGDTTVSKDMAECLRATKEASTFELDAILHVVASSGDSEDFTKCADVIYGKAKHLLDAANEKGDTPFHCAARAGNVAMVAHLIEMARREGGDTRVKAVLDEHQNEQNVAMVAHLIVMARREGGDARVKAVLEHQNEQLETVLHQALRLPPNKVVEMVDKLLSEDTELARFPCRNGTSPLYLAVMLEHYDIAESLCQKDKELSYSGPDGQNVLHVAVLRSKEMTAKLLGWNKDLTKQRDKTTGSTPLHIAISWGRSDEVIKLLLEADKSSAFQHDNRGSFPIHVAAMKTLPRTIRMLLTKYPSCAGLQDAGGKTFLHIAVGKGCRAILRECCCGNGLESILNTQDNNGNTALHFAVELGRQWCFYYLIQNKQVQLSLMNNKGQTPLDIAWMHIPAGVFYTLDPRLRIYELLKRAGAQPAAYRLDWFKEKHVRKLDIKEEAKKISDSTQIIGIGAVLIVTVAFAAAFTLPGGFRADDAPQNGTAKLAGTATLAENKVFHAFIIANTLALVLSSLATESIMYAGVPTVNISTRMAAFVISIGALVLSSKFLGAAFAFGMYVVLAPVPSASPTAYISCAITFSFVFLDVAWVFSMVAIGQYMLIKRLGWRLWFRQFRRSREIRDR